MSRFTDEQLMETDETVKKAMELANKIVSFLVEQKVDMKIAVLACGILFGRGAPVLGASLPSTIDIVRYFYKNPQGLNETH